MRPDSVHFLAAGWSLATADAHGTSIAIQDDERTILFDAGGEVAKGMARVGGLSTLDCIYLTHEHPDHTWGYPGLVHCLRFTGRDRPLQVKGPEPALERVRNALEVLDVTYPFDIQYTPIEGRASDDLARWMPMDHSVPTLGYRIGDVTICGDTSPTDETVDLARDGSLLVHEATHTDTEKTHSSGHATPHDAGQLASRADVDTLALIHIHPSLDRKTARTETGFPNTHTPTDGDQLERTANGWC
jgi:ribonuclease Z